MRTSRYARKRSFKKPIIALSALVLSVALTIGSALAWTDFTQSKVNKFRGTTDPDVTLHDEFDGENKDVFVENTGKSTIYVRIRLDEFMQVGDTIFGKDADGNDADAKDKSTWSTHTYSPDRSHEDCGKAENGKFHDFYKWTMSGNARGYNQGTPGMVYDKLDSYGKVDTTGSNTTLVKTNHVLMSEYITLKGKAESQLATDWGIEAAMNAAELKQWKHIQKGCWILDDAKNVKSGGGWAYWSRPLLPDTATNLLLDEVKLIKEPAEDWIYRIDVKLQAVTANDFGKWSSDGNVMSKNANILKNSWQ